MMPEAWGSDHQCIEASSLEATEATFMQVARLRSAKRQSRLSHHRAGHLLLCLTKRHVVGVCMLLRVNHTLRQAMVWMMAQR